MILSSGYYSERVQYLQAHLFPVYTISGEGFLGSFLSKNLKTNQLEVNTDEKTLKPIARLKEPRDLFALSKDIANDCSQQAARWPTECQVLEERVYHIESIPELPEPYYKPTGHELKPRPVGEENGIVVFNYNPVSAVHYTNKSNADSDGKDSDSDSSSCSSRSSSAERDVNRQSKKHGGSEKSSNKINTNTDDYRNREPKNLKKFSKLFPLRNSSSNSDFGNEDEEYNNIQNDEEDDIYYNANDKDDLPDCNQRKSNLKNINSQQDEQEEEEIEEKLQDFYEPDFFDPTPIKTKLTKVNPLTKPVIKNVAQIISTICMKAQIVDSSNELDKSYHTVESQLNKLHINNINSNINCNCHDSSCKSINNNLCSCSSSTLFIESHEKSQTPSNKNHQSFCNDNNDKTEIHHQNQHETITKYQTFIKNKNNNYNFNENNDKNKILCSHSSKSNDRNLNIMLSKLTIGLSQFSRSSVGGSKLINPNQLQQQDNIDVAAGIGDGNNINNLSDSLEFESRFESGNLAKAVKITSTYYELYLRPDMYTNRHKQWFYFRVCNTKKNVLYRFSIVNLVKSDSLYNEGMRPLMYSNLNAKLIGIGWRRCGDNICYFKNDEEASSEDEDDNTSYTLTFNIQFPHDNDTVYFAHSYPYTYSDLQDYLMEIQNHPIKSKYCKLRLLCRSLAGNNVYYLTVTAPSEEEEVKKKRAIVVSARVHPGETPSSWMMKGLMDFITGDTNAAKRLRHKFIFKLIPMLNPDGVIVGNTRSSLTGKDLNRQYRTVIRETYPSIWYTKAMIKRLIDECGVAMYCDMHAHSRAHNIFIYGCENKRQPDKKLLEQVFPLMVHKNCADKFSFESCKFKIQRNKEGTGRIVIWMLGILNSYTIEASFGGTSLGSRCGTHFSTADYEHVGRSFCETLLDYYDEHPNKVNKRERIFKRIKRLRKREKRERKAIKLKKLAEEGCIIDNMIITEKTF